MLLDVQLVEDGLAQRLVDPRVALEPLEADPAQVVGQDAHFNLKFDW